MQKGIIVYIYDLSIISGHSSNMLALAFSANKETDNYTLLENNTPRMYITHSFIYIPRLVSMETTVPWVGL